MTHDEYLVFPCTERPVPILRTLRLTIFYSLYHDDSMNIIKLYII